LIIPFKGDFLAFRKQKFFEEIKIGRILGIKEVFTGATWETSVFAKQRGSCLFVKLNDIDYYGTVNSTPFGSFIEFLLNQEAKRLSDSKRSLQYMANNQQMKNDSFDFMNPNNSEKPIEDKTITDFMEVDVREKKLNLGVLNNLATRKEEFYKDFKTDLAIPPLFVHKCFKFFFEEESIRSNILDNNKVI
jgi:hypothetical protein